MLQPIDVDALLILRSNTFPIHPKLNIGEQYMPIPIGRAAIQRRERKLLYFDLESC
jgi:hypothetical protein